VDDRALLERIAAAVGVTTDVSVTVGMLYMRWRATRPRGRAWQLQRNLLRPFVVRYWRRPAKSIGPRDWNEHRARRRREPTRTGRPPCELTLNMELKATKRMFRWAVSRKLLDERPLIDCKPVKTRDRRESWFTAEQIDRLISAADSLRWDHQQRAFRALAAVMGDTGLRISEALGLRWDRITLRGTTSVLGKGHKTRIVAFTSRTLEALAALDRFANPHVFTNYHTCRPFDPSTVRIWFRAAIAAAGLEGVKVDGDLALVPHNLRHSAASIADERGAPAQWIQSMLGHAHLATTMKYLHRTEHDAALRMAAIMSDRRPPRRVASKLRVSHEKEVVKVSGRRVTSFS
jgi:integrase